jgi:hypothetical protein
LASIGSRLYKSVCFPPVSRTAPACHTGGSLVFYRASRSGDFVRVMPADAPAGLRSAVRVPLSAVFSAQRFNVISCLRIMKRSP